MTIFRLISYYLLLVTAILLSINKVFPHHHHHQETCCAADHDIEDNHDASEFCHHISFFLITGKKENSIKEKQLNEHITPFTDISSVISHIPFIVYRYSFRYLIKQDLTLQDVKDLVRAMRGPPAS